MTRSYTRELLALAFVAIACTDPVSPPAARTPVVALASPSQAVAEDAGAAQVAVSLDVAASAEVTVPYTVGGTAAGRHGLVDGSLTIAAGQTTATIAVPITDDASWNGGAEATVVVTLGTPVGATLGTVHVHTLALTDDEPKPVVTFAEATTAVSEDAGGVSVEVRASGAATVDLVVPFTVSGTAGAQDFDLLPGTVTIAAGAQTGAIAFTIADEDLFEGLEETVVLTLGAQDGAATDAVLEHTVSITDDETPPVVSLPVTALEASEASGSVQVAVALSGPSARDIVLPVLLGGSAEASDHGLASDATVVVPAGELQAALTVELVQDAVYEALSEDVLVLELQPAAGAKLGLDHAVALTLLDDDDAPTVRFTQPRTTLREGAGGSIELALSHPSETALTVELVPADDGSALAGTDFAWPNGAQVVVAPFGTAATVAVSASDDDVYEGEESNVLTIAVVEGGVPGAELHALVVEDADPRPSVEFATADGEISEGQGTLTFEVRLSNVSAHDVLVPYSVYGTAEESDHSLRAGTITIPARATTGTVNFAPTADALDEADEPMVVDIGLPTGATRGLRTTLTLTIVDDDPTPTVGFTEATSTHREDVGALDLAVVLSSPSSFFVTVPYTRTSTNARFPAESGSVSFAPGETRATIALTNLEDDAASGHFTITYTLETPENAGLGAIAARTVSVLDDDLGALLHLSADTLPLTSGAPVTQWNDASAHAHHATLVDGTTAPTFEATAANGEPAVRFTGGSQLVTTPVRLFADASAARTIVAVVRPAEARTMSLVQHGTASCGAARFAVDGAEQRFGVDAGCTNRTLSSDGWAPLGELQILTVVVQAAGTAPSNVTAFRNGLPIATHKHADGFPSAGGYPTGLDVLAIGGGTGAGGFAGDLAELTVYEGAFFESRRRAMECGLAAKYRLSGIVGCAQPCADVKRDNPAATDGDYLVPFEGLAAPVRLYCADMDTDPKEYLPLAATSTPLAHAGGQYRANCFTYVAGDARPGTDVVTCYERLRIDPATLWVDRTDRRFASSVGDVSGTRSMDYASAGNCIWGAGETLSGHGLIDLTGTPFALSDDTSFAVNGWFPYGAATVAADRRTAHLWGGGYCGDVAPARGLLHLKPAP